MTRTVKHENKWFIVFFITIFFISIGSWWLNAINVDPVIKIKNPKPPKPNAYNYFLAAAKSIVDGDKVAYALNSRPKSWKKTTTEPGDRYYSPAEKDDVIRNNAPTLKTFRNGFNYEYLDPATLQSNQVFGLSYYAKFRDLARLIKLEAYVNAEKGDYRNAVNSCIDGVHFGTELYKGGADIGYLVGAGVEAITLSKTNDYASNLNGKDAASLARKLEQIINNKYTLSQILGDEKRSGLKSILISFTEENWRKGIFIGNWDWTSFSKSREFVTSKIRFQTASKRKIVHNYTNYMNLAIESCKKPYSIKSSEISIPNDPVNELIAPNIKNIRFHYERTCIKERFLLLQLAMRAYRLDNGRYLNSLSELAPNYLTKLQVDPFGSGKHFVYKRTGDSFILYSLGPDCKDDGGLAANTNKYIDQNSKGDIVLGVSKKI